MKKLRTERRFRVALALVVASMASTVPVAIAADDEPPEEPARGGPLLTVPVAIDGEAFGMMLVGGIGLVQNIASGADLEINVQFAGSDMDPTICVVFETLGCIGRLPVDAASGEASGSVTVPRRVAEGTYTVSLKSENLGVVAFGETTVVAEDETAVTAAATRPRSESGADEATEARLDASAAPAPATTPVDGGFAAPDPVLILAAVVVMLALLTAWQRRQGLSTAVAGLHTRLSNRQQATAGRIPEQRGPDRRGNVADALIGGAPSPPAAGTAPPGGDGPERRSDHPDPIHADSTYADPALARSPVRLSFLIKFALMTVAIVTATTAGTYFFSLSLAPVYVAEAELDVRLGGLTNTAQIERRLASIEAVSTSGAVLEPLSETYGIPLLELNFAATTVGDSSLMRVEASDADPDTALGIVTMGTGLVIDLATQSQDSAERATIEAEIVSMQQALDDVNARLAEIDVEDARLTAEGTVALPTAEKQLLILESDALTGRLVALEERLLDLKLEEDRSAVVISTLTEPRLLDEQRPLPRLQAIALGGFLGLLLASVAGVILWQPRRRERSSIHPDPQYLPVPRDRNES